jgi:acyl-CoA reductase-like NAD-dependent aldehyde dehydrogenase
MTVIAHAPLSSAEDVDRAVRAARRGMAGSSTTTPGERALALKVEHVTVSLA